MALDEYQQAYTHLGNSRNVLIIVGTRDIDDTYPAALAFKRALQQIRKETFLFAPRAIPGQLKFLEDKEFHQQVIGASQDVILSIDVSQKPVKRISYNNSTSSLDIRVTPSPGVRIEEGDIQIKLSNFNYDSIIIIGVDDLGVLEKEFERNASFFYETPIINLDRNPSNERYGEVNIIEPTRSSCSEIVSRLIKKWDENLMTKEVATPLLAGIIAATGNFQNSRTKPNTLYEAAYLMGRRADRQEIIKNLFKTKSFELLKLWGIAMSKLKYVEDSGIAWLSITSKDFLESGTGVETIPTILAELKNNFDQAGCFIIFWENHSRHFGIIHSIYEERLEPLREWTGGERRGDNIVFALSSKDAGEREKIINAASYALKKSKLQ